MFKRTSVRAVISACALIVGLNCASVAHAQVQGTIGSFIGSLSQLVTQLNDAANQSIANGNNALAQQQIILAGTIQQTIDHLKSAYADSMNKTFAQVDTTEGNIAGDLLNTIGSVSNLEHKSYGDVQDVIYHTQSGSNQLLDRIPFTKRYPVFYAVSVADLSGGQPVESDIEIIGYAFTDPRLNFKAPLVRVDGHLLLANSISVRNDRIEISLPDDVKRAVGYGADPCNPRGTFPIEVTSYYTVPHLFGLLHRPEEMGFHANALASEPRFTVSMFYSGVRTVSSITDPIYFSQTSGAVNVGCEDNGSTSVATKIPLSAIQPTCTAQWVNTSNLKNQNQTACVVSGENVSASGDVRGRDRQGVDLPFGGRIANCPGGGHGSLQISGSYRLPASNQSPLNDVPIEQQAVLSRDHSDVVLPADTTLRINSLRLAFSRKACQASYDNATMALPANPLQAVSQTTSGGHFAITVRQSQVTITPLQ